MRHASDLDNSQFVFKSGWYYSGEGDRQTLKLSIEKNTAEQTQYWEDEHPMVAVSFDELKALLEPYFDVHVFEHDYDKILPLPETSGNAIFTCVKR